MYGVKKLGSTILVILGFMTLMTGCAKNVEPEEMMQVEGVALDGYDAVAYFEAYQAIQADFSHNDSYKGLEWYFDSDENKRKFSENPERYLPAFGGFCAYELAYENLVMSDPQHWYIHNDRLYLFSSESAKEEWFEQMAALLPLADKEWKALNPPEEVFEEIGDAFINPSQE